LAAERIQLLTRRNCPLCELARSTLAELAGDRRWRISEFDVDEDPDLLREFTDRVPVIRYRGQVVAEGRIEPVDLQAALQRISPAGREGPDDSVTAADLELDRG